MRLALFEPDIAQNTGTMIRLASCFNLPIDIIEPCGFLWNDKHFKRAGMDYISKADITRYLSFEHYLEEKPKGRLILLTTHASEPYSEFAFEKEDILLLGRESAGVPEEVHHKADGRVRIPMAEGFRSLNVALSAGIVLGEGMRQTNLFKGLV